VVRRLLDGPGRPVGGASTEVQLVGEERSHLGRRQTGDAGQAAQPEERQAVVVAGLELRRRRRQHEAADGLRVTAPQQLGDGAAHRVADGDGRGGFDDGEQLGDVVGAILEPEPAPTADAVAVAAVVERQHAEVLAERVVARVVVEVRGGRPAVQQHDGRRARRPGQLAEPDGAGRQVDLARRRQLRRDGRDADVVERRQLGVDPAVDHLGQAAATSRIRTRNWAPVGVS
jgi:hypothetical protein